MQNEGIKRKFYFLVLILILLTILISLPKTNRLRSLTSTLIYPFQFTGDAALQGVRRGVSSIVELRKAALENIYLKQEAETAKAQLQILAELKQENLRLKNALGFKADNRYNFRLVPAKVIGKSPTSWFSQILINRGKSSGVKENMAVIAQEGLVGRVVEVSPLNAKVMLLINPDSSIAAVNQRSRDFGIVEGVLPNKLYLKYVDAAADIQVGDLIATSYLSDFSPPGIPIGKVLSAFKKESDLFYQIRLKPAVDFSKVEEVFVVVK